MEGWPSLWQKKGMYDRPTLEDTFRLPYTAGPWLEVAAMFELAMETMNLQGGERILDIGAGQGWASRYFAEKGAQVVAVDIVADEWYGLGRSWALMEHADVSFDPIIADGERLPFADDFFDYVFTCGALHHFENLSRALTEFRRVLRPSGRVIATGEPSIAFHIKEADVQAILEETEEGIIERRPHVLEYHLAFRRAGLAHIRVRSRETFHEDPRTIRTWMCALEANLRSSVRWRWKPVLWAYFRLMQLLPPTWAGLITLYLNGGNLIIEARKPTPGHEGNTAP